MRITVLGKTGCGKCESAKQKLEIMGFKYSYIAMDNAENWRENGAVDALAATAFASLDFTHPPIIVIDNIAYEYSKAMKVLKGMK